VRTWDRLSGALLLLVAVGVGYESSKLPLGQLSLPGPGFQPFWTSVVLGILSLALIVEASVHRSKAGQTLWPLPAAVGKAIAVMAALVGYALVLDRVGYLVATSLLLALLLVLGRQRWPIVAGVALVSALASYWVFAVWLQVPLPGGLLGR
jgi:putative tricarboxylic transport membrane protein